MTKISIIVSTNRTVYWRRFCDYVANDKSVELIFVGPLDGATDLPLPVRFLKTDVNPARCWAIGAAAATSSHLCFAPDDIIFTPGFFDLSASIIAGGIGPYDMLTACFYYNNGNMIGGMRMMSAPHMPLTPVCGVLSRDSYNRLGGIDRRFNAVLWDADLYMRFYEAGGRTTLLDGYSCNEMHPQNEMFVQNYNRDFDIIKTLWYRHDQPQCQRNLPTQSYTEAELRC